jgi:hypothetical protein
VSGAERQRRHRALDRAGIKVLRVKTKYFAFVEALLVAGRLTEESALQRSSVEAEASEILAEWSRRWLQTKE